jgi:hypothetical protein
LTTTAVWAAICGAMPTDETADEDESAADEDETADEDELPSAIAAGAKEIMTAAQQHNLNILCKKGFIKTPFSFIFHYPCFTPSFYINYLPQSIENQQLLQISNIYISRTCGIPFADNQIILLTS